ncbi:hypothetical protein HK102_006018, partial [Quaeritorhiza haematococci]
MATEVAAAVPVQVVTPDVVGDKLATAQDLAPASDPAPAPASSTATDSEAATPLTSTGDSANSASTTASTETPATSTETKILPIEAPPCQTPSANPVEGGAQVQTTPSTPPPKPRTSSSELHKPSDSKLPIATTTASSAPTHAHPVSVSRPTTASTKKDLATTGKGSSRPGSAAVG